MLHRAQATIDRPQSWRDYVVPQCWDAFTDDDHAVWDLLFARQVELLGTRVVAPFLDGIDLLRLSHPGVPDLDELNAILEPRTGWRTVAVTGLVPDEIFFAMLGERVFPVGNFIRRREQLDYLEEPDCFHDLFGHIPMLAHHDFAAMVEHVGRAGQRGDRRRARASWSRGFTGTASNSASHWKAASSRSSAPGSPRASAKRISASRATRSSGCPSRWRGRSAPPYRNDVFQPLYLVSQSVEATIAEILASRAEGLLAIA